ncbi:MAG: REP-associated tyrosine transposase [Thermodesulfobacteriota bacterium]|nr:REP-associated tyrosine transposase [Thermodesulfobacteriota bacterium]
MFVKTRGLKFEEVLQKVVSLFNVEKNYIIGKGRQRDRVEARDLLCYWCAVELEIPMADLARRLNLTLAAVSFAVKRGEKAAKEGCWRQESG